MDIFDDWGIGYKDNEFTVIYYKDFIGELMPSNYAARSYNQKYEDENSEIIDYTFYDMSGVSGDWELVTIIKYSAAKEILPISMVISPSSYIAQLSRESKNAFLTNNF